MPETMSSQKYKPIPCHQYDELALLSLKGVWIEAEIETSGKRLFKIADIKTEGGAEFVESNFNQRFRLDTIETIRELDVYHEGVGILLKTLDYNQWANDRFIDHLSGLDGYPESISRLMSHILNAMDIWISRIKTNESNFEVWQIHNESKWQELNNNLCQESLMIATERSLNDWIHYKNTKGVAGSRQVGHILYHLVNHSTYHRGQMALELNNAGLKAVSTDYFIYK